MRRRTLTILDNGVHVVAENLTFAAGASVQDHADVTNLPDEAFQALRANRAEAKPQRDHAGQITGVRIGRRVHHFRKG